MNEFCLRRNIDADSRDVEFDYLHGLKPNF